MKLDVSEAIRNPGTEYVFRGEQAIAAQEISGEVVSYDTAVLEGTFFATDEGNIAVDGVVRSIAHARCARCLAPASAAISAEYHETFLHNGDPEDEESFSYEGHEVDLDRMAEMYILMETPMRFLCEGQCGGVPEGFAAEDYDVSLCAEEDMPTGQRPFAALQQLLDEQSGKDE